VSFANGGTGAYSRSDVPAGDWSATFWYRVNTGDFSTRALVGLGADSSSVYSGAELNYSGDADLNGDHGETTSTDVVQIGTDETWIYVLVTYEAETGGGGNGTLTVYYLEDGQSAFQNDEALTSLSDLAVSNMLIGTNLFGLANQAPDDGLWASVKFYDAVISTADALTEREWTENQTGNEHATYEFLDGALATDSSANGYDLTAEGTGHTYSATMPTDLSVGSPSGGGGLSIPIAIRHYNQMRI